MFLFKLVWANLFMLSTFLFLVYDLTVDFMRLSSMVLLYCFLFCLSAFDVVFFSFFLFSLLNFCLRVVFFFFSAIFLYRLEFSFFFLRGVRGVLGCCFLDLDCCRNLVVFINGVGVGLGVFFLFFFFW